MIRFMMRDENTGMRVVGNIHVECVVGCCELQQNTGSDQMWVWLATDCSNGKEETERLALVFASRELALKFKKMFDEAKELG